MRFFIVLLFLSLSYLTIAQDNPLEELFKESGELFFSFELSNLEELPKFNKLVSLDHKQEGHTIYAYANKNQFKSFLDENIAYTVLPKPGNRIVPKMLTTEEWKILKSTDCNNAWDYYPTYDLYETMMLDFATAYPAICSLLEIGELPSGRKLLALKITDNVDQEEAEPKFLYTSSMHGDETAGYILLMRLADHLLCNYEIDDKVTELVNEIEIWINPLANPDGSYTNNDATLSGATRSNANLVDLNRNFPDPVNGPHPDGNVYQPETIAWIDFHNTHTFDISSNMHGGIEVANYPWDSYEELHADDDWWVHVCREYADNCQANSPDGYFEAFDNGITNGYAWYEVDGGRQDYVCYEHYGREFTLELSNEKLLDENELTTHWTYNYQSLLKFMNQSLFGIRGIVTDSLTGEPLIAEVFIDGHDKKNTQVNSRLPHGNYHRFLKENFYALTFTADGYEPKTIGVQSIDNAVQILDVQLAQPISTSVAPELSNESFSVFPNPTNSKLYFNMQNENSQSIDIKLYDFVGRTIFEKKLSNSKGVYHEELNISSVPKGTYILEASNSTGRAYEKVLIH